MPDEQPVVRKRVDEDWKERIDKEQVAPPSQPDQPAKDQASVGAAPPEAEALEARFDVFVSGLAMEALIALGDMPHPATKKRGVNLPHAKYLIDLLGILEEKTRGNRTADESQLFTDLLYQLRMRYLSKSGS